MSTFQIGGEITVNRLGFGAMQITGSGVWGPPRDKAEAAYGDLVEDLPRSICPTVPGVRSIMKLMVEMGINPKAANLKVEDVVDLTLCKQLGGDGK